jgi:localization factor PodJL
VTREASATPSQAAPSRGRPGGFASPIPADGHGEDATDFEAFQTKSLSLDEPEADSEGQRDLSRSTHDQLDLGQELIGASLLDGFEGDTDSTFLDLGQDWNDLVAIDEVDAPSVPNSESAQPTSPASENAKADIKNTKSAAASLKGKAAGKHKVRSGLSPVAMAAAAALVTAGGFAVYSQMNATTERNQQPDVRNQDPADPVGNPVVNNAASQIPAEPAQTPATPASVARPSFDPPPAATPQAAEKAQFNPPELPKPTKARFTQPPIERVRPATSRQSASALPAKVTSKAAQSPVPAMNMVPNGPVTGPSPAAVAPPASAASQSPTTPSRVLFEQAVSKEQAGDIAGSLALLNRAVEAGDVRAMNRLAKKYETGDGVAKDLGQARALTERAAARGSTEAMHNLGVYYAQGDGVPSNMVRAADYFRRAARRGIADSQFNLGAMAEQGLGGPKSDLQAYYWYGIASKSGDQDAAAKAREVGQRLTTEQRAAQDKLIAQFRPEASPAD